MVVGSKRLKSAYQSFDKLATHKVSDAVKLILDHKKTKFDETIEISMNLGVDPRHADQMVRGVVSLPNGTGKSVRVAVFTKAERAEEARGAGADLVGAEDLAQEIQGGKIDFDRCIATPDMMSVVGKLGKVLGPKGLMPNPKLGTVTQNIVEAIKAVKGGEIEFKVEKAGIVQAGIGKSSFAQKAIEENVDAFVKAILKAKPSGAKGTYLERVTLSSTMGPGIRLDVASLTS